jgi:teichuronic acid biosynthesis glycosyltransferase TuaC
MEAARKTASTPSSSKLKVLQVSNHWEMKRSFVFSGIFVDRQIDSLKNAGIEISTFDIGTSHSPFKVFKKWLALRRKVKEVNPHLIHGQYGSIVGLLSVLSGRPAVVSFCRHDLLTGSSVSALRMYVGFLFSNLAALRAVGLICKSEQLRQALWWKRSRAVVIPNGVDLDLFAPGCQEQARKELGWGLQKRVVIINVGSNPIRKGLALAKEAMKVTQARVPEAELCVISNVKPQKMVLYYRAADVLVCTSKHEGSPNVVKEALACNLPVVSIHVGDVPLQLNGVYPSATVDSNPVAIGEALSDVLLNRIRSNGREHVCALSLDKIAKQVMEVYSSALETS